MSDGYRKRKFTTFDELLLFSSLVDLKLTGGRETPLHFKDDCTLISDFYLEVSSILSSC